MSNSRSVYVIVCLIFACVANAQAQLVAKAGPAKTGGSDPIEGTSSSSVLHLIRYDGVIDSKLGLPLPNVEGITFALYSDKDGGTPLWIETQNVLVDEQGHYSALLGSTKAEGVPEELFSTGQARWLGIQVSGQLVETRIPLGSVPYALQAVDAETLGGKAANDFVTAEQMGEQVRSELRAVGFDIPESGASGGAFRTQAQPADPGSNGNGVGISNQDLNNKLILMDGKLDQILTFLNQPPQVLSFQLCTEPAVQVEYAGKSDMVLKGNVTGSLGAKFAGNGGLVSLHANPEGGFETGGKIAWDALKLGVCADLRAWIQRKLDGLPLQPPGGGVSGQLRKAAFSGDASAAATSNLLDQIAGLDEDALVGKMLGVADGLQFDPQKLQNLLDRIQSLSFDGGPLAILQDNEDRTEFVEALPMPPAFRAVLSNPAGLLTKFKNLLDSGVCNLGMQAPALDPLLGPICELAANEPFAQLLHRVDDVTDNIDTVTDHINSTVNTVNSRVSTINTVVQNIQGRLPADGDCKLFCHDKLFPLP